jgi:hypothetical protein
MNKAVVQICALCWLFLPRLIMHGMNIKSVRVVLILAEIRLRVLETSICTVTEGNFDMYGLDLHPVLTLCSYHVSWMHSMNKN